MIKALVSDLDGTLFKGYQDTYLNLTSDNQKALAKLKENGISFYISSGRHVIYGEAILKHYGFTDMKVSGYNGSHIIDNEKTICSYNLDHDLLEEIYHTILEDIDTVSCMQLQTDAPLRIFYDASVKEAQDIIRLYEKTGIGPIADYDMDTYFNSHQKLTVSKITMVMKEPNHATQMMEKLRKIYGERCFVTCSSDTFVEVQNLNGNKGNFIRYLQTIGFKQEEIAVIGDALNDEEMFPDAGLRFAMTPGSPILQAASDVVVNSVSEAIEYILSQQ